VEIPPPPDVGSAANNGEQAGSTTPARRWELMCANPNCWYLVNPDPSFGGYCGKKCHWHGKAKRSRGAKKHGGQCLKQDAPEGAPRAPPVTPDKPLKDADPGDFEEGVSPVVDRDTPIGEFGKHASAGLSDGAFEPKPVGLVGREVRVCGLVKNKLFNGLTAHVERETEDGRFDLLLADGTRLRWIKQENFQGPINSQEPDLEPEPFAISVNRGPDAGVFVPPPGLSGSVAEERAELS
jgi:hypothetical protein